MSAEPAATRQGVIPPVDAARLPRLGELFTAPASLAASTRVGARFTVMCGCEPRRALSITPRQYGTAPLICGACRATFEPC